MASPISQCPDVYARYECGTMRFFPEFDVIVVYQTIPVPQDADILRLLQQCNAHENVRIRYPLSDKPGGLKWRCFTLKWTDDISAAFERPDHDERIRRVLLHIDEGGREYARLQGLNVMPQVGPWRRMWAATWSPAPFSVPPFRPIKIMIGPDTTFIPHCIHDIVPEDYNDVVGREMARVRAGQPMWSQYWYGATHWN